MQTGYALLLASRHNVTFNIDSLTGCGIDAVEYRYYLGSNFVANSTYTFIIIGSRFLINATKGQLVHI
jgi:hypothetical protein